MWYLVLLGGNKVMSRRFVFFAVFMALFVLVHLCAQENEVTLPEEVTLAVDRVVELVIDTVPHSENVPALVAVRSIELENRIPPFGELFSLTVSTRIALASEPGLAVRSHLPVDSYLNEFSSQGAGSAPEEEFSAKADFVLIGESFETSGNLHLLFQIIDVEDETIVGGFEDVLMIDQWLYDLLGNAEYDDGTVYVEPDRFEPDSMDSPLIISPEDTIGDRTIGPPGDEDWYAIEFSDFDGKMMVDVYTSGDTDTYIEAYGPGDPYVLIEENDDSIDSNARVSVLAESGQTIWILVRGYDESVGGYYSLHSESSMFDGDPYEPDNSMDEANRLSIGGGPISSYILPSTDEDWYLIDISEMPDENTILSVGTTGSLDTFLDLYDEDGIELLSNDDGGDEENARIDMFLESTGRYYIKVTHYDGSDQGEYQISADFLSAMPDRYEPDDSRSEAVRIDLGERQDKNFTPSDDLDWVTFDLAETSTVMIGTSGDADTYLKLFDRAGNMIAEDDDSGDDYNGLIERMLQRGQYYVRVNQVEIDSAFGAEYQLLIDKQ